MSEPATEYKTKHLRYPEHNLPQSVFALISRNGIFHNKIFSTPDSAALYLRSSFRHYRFKREGNVLTAPIGKYTITELFYFDNMKSISNL